MKLFSILILMCLCQYALAQTNINFVVKDQQTGFAVPGATVTVTAPNGTTSTLQAAKNGKLSFKAVNGKYTFKINAGNYQSLETNFSTGEEGAFETHINLDPVAASTAKEPARQQSQGNAINITGYVSDADENAPLAGVQVRVGNATATTNDKGFFTIQVAAATTDFSGGKIPEKLIVQSVKNGFVNYSLQNFYAIPGSYTLKIGLTSTASPRLKQARISEEIQSTPHGIFDRTEADEIKRYAAPVSKNNARVDAITAAVPGSIRVGTGCTCHDCGAVQVMSLEAYTESGLDEEWIASWGFASLQAGAVAYRSYGAWFVQHPIRSNYDIASTTCAQAWGSDVVASTRDAARSTAGIVLIKDGAIFRSEYSAENNNSGCGNGFSGTGSTWPCISDARCAGRAKNGHGRGMCQWGSSFWASDQNYNWILNHYYNPGGVIVQQPYVLIANGTYRITNVGSGKVLDAIGCSGNNGTGMNQWDWWGGDCQRWAFTHQGDGWYKITCAMGGRALDNASCLAADGNKIQLWDWLNNDCQRWKIEDWGNGQVRIVNKASGKLLDVDNMSTANGATVWQWSYNGTNAQRWTLQIVSANYIADGNYRVRLQRNNKVLEPSGGNDNRGAAMNQWDWVDSSYQTWRFENTPDGWYKITSPKGFALDVENCNTLDGGKVMLWDWLNNDCQKWSLAAAGNGTFNIVNKNSVKVLDAAGTANGGIVYQWLWTNNENQKWFVETPPAARVMTQQYVRDFSLAPNPIKTGTALTITYRSLISQAATVVIYDILGRPVQQNKVQAQQGFNRYSLNTAALRAGTYMVTFQTGNNGEKINRKIVVR